MTKVIWKYPLAVTSENWIEMPWGAEVLTVQRQGEAVCLWAKVDPTADKKKRMFVVLPTGMEYEEFPSRYIGTFQVHGGALIFHVFEALS